MDEPSLDKELHVMRDGGLALSDWVDEVADADLALWGGAEEVEETEPHWIGECGESHCQLVGVALTQGWGRAPKRSTRRQRLQAQHFVWPSHSPIDNSRCIAPFLILGAVTAICVVR